VRRIHLFELEDQPWFPAIVRDLATDYLHFMQTTIPMGRAIAPVIRQALEAGATTRIVDLCSGGAGPLPEVLTGLAQQHIHATATLTDLYPNVDAFERAARASGGVITYVRTPVDARNVPRELTGLRTLFNGFHHFRPSDASAILLDAARADQPIVVFEMSRRSIVAMLSVLLLPVIVCLTTPFIRPFRWSRLFFTYVVPLVPLTCLWDGFVSQLRAYTPDELTELGRAANNMIWRAGYTPLSNGPGQLTYLVGWPVLVAGTPTLQRV
jgi:hypothetical protein